MNDADRRKHAARVNEAAMRAVEKLNEELNEELAICRCDKCPNPKQENVRELDLPNGVRLSLYYCHCESPNSDCTAGVASHLPSESPSVANRIVEWLVEQPDLKPLGVTWWTCGEDRHVLTYPTPAEAKVVTAVGAVPVDEFRRCKR